MLHVALGSLQRVLYNEDIVEGNLTNTMQMERIISALHFYSFSLLLSSCMKVWIITGLVIQDGSNITILAVAPLSI